MKAFLIAISILFGLSSNGLAQKAVPDYVDEFLKEHPNPPGTFSDLKEAMRKPGEVIVLNLALLKAIPKEIRSFKNLEELYITQSEISQLPSWLLELKKLKRLTLDCKLTDFLDFIFDIKSLEYIDLNGNNIQSFTINGIKNNRLKELEISFSHMIEIPSCFSNLESLETLRIENNKLTTISKVIDDMKSLKFLYLYRNKIYDYDDNIINAKNLKGLFIQDNPISNSKVNELRVLLPNCNINHEDF